MSRMGVGRVRVGGVSTQIPFSSCVCVCVCVCTGIKKLRFKPAYNPYTEPSMEVFSYHDGEDRLEWARLVWVRLVWVRLVWVGLVWVGLVWANFGLG